MSENECQQPAAPDPIYQVVPKSVWLRIGNCETPGRFKVVLEVTDWNGVTHDRVIYDSIDECDGNISQQSNISWLVRSAR